MMVMTMTFALLIFTAEMASTMMELTAEARQYWLGPWNPNYHLTRVLESTMERVISF